MEQVEFSQDELQVLLSMMNGFVKQRDLSVGDVIVIGKIAEKINAKYKPVTPEVPVEVVEPTN